MNSIATLALTFGLLAFSAVAVSAGADAPSNGAKVDAMVKSLAVAPARTLGKAASYCTANHQPAGQALDARLKTYVAAMSAGTREAMLEIAKTDPAFLQSTPPYSGKDYEMMDKQAETILQQVQASPADGCAKLGTTLDAGNSAFFKDYTLQGYREYQAKRAQYCARSPKPANCN